MSSKINFKFYEDKIKYLQLYLDHIIKEKDLIKKQFDDMKVTAQKNKDLLKEYIYSITTKDQIVENLQYTIQNLHERIKSYDEYIKKTIFIKNCKTPEEKVIKAWDIPTICLKNMNLNNIDNANISFLPRVGNSSIKNCIELKEVIKMLNSRSLLNRTLFLRN